MYLPPFFKGPLVIGQLTQKPFNGHMWAVPLLFLHQLSRSGVDSKCAVYIWKLFLRTHIMRSIPIALKTKQIDQRDSRNMRSGQINSLVQFPRKSQVKNTLQEVDVSLSVYDQEKTSREQIQRGFITSCTQGQIRLSQKTSKKSQTTSGKLSLDGWN